MSLPRQRDETLHERSTVENGFMNRLQDRIVAIHENENFERQVINLKLSGTDSTNANWTYVAAGHYFSSGGAVEHVSPIGGRLLSEGSRIVSASLLQQRATGSTFAAKIVSRDATDAAAPGAVASELVHCTFDNAKVFDDWELVQSFPVADESSDPDAPMVISLARHYYLVAVGTTAEFIAALKLEIERPV